MKVDNQKKHAQARGFYGEEEEAGHDARCANGHFHTPHTPKNPKPPTPKWRTLGAHLALFGFLWVFYLKIANIALETSTNLSLNVYGPRSTCQYRTPIYQHSVSNKPSFLVICLDKTRAIKSVVEISGVLKQGKVEIGTIKTTFELQLQGGLINEYITSTQTFLQLRKNS